MTLPNYDAMSLDELRQYVLTHRDDTSAFHRYVDRSQATGRMITIDLDDAQWEAIVDQKIRQASADRD
jgi:hypothetical protein